MKNKSRKAPKSENVYLKLHVKLYRFLARRTDAPFNETVLKRLFMSRMNRPPMTIRKMARLARGKTEDKIVVLVGTVTDDKRVEEIPKMTVCALRFTETARARIVKSGGECITFDELARRAPTGSNTLLVRGRRNARESNKHFGAPGVRFSKARPYARAKGRKFEKARGKRQSRGFKV